MVSFKAGPGPLIKRATNLVQAYWPKQEIFDYSRDKIIIYCHIRNEVTQLANLLQYSLYTSESGSDEEKAAILS
jgi:hypothetical protein